MTLRSVLLDSENTIVMELIRSIPAELLEKDSDEYTQNDFLVIQKSAESYAREISFLGRLDAVIAINDVLGCFFCQRFPKACRIERLFESTEVDILLLKLLQGGSDQSLYAMSQEAQAERMGISTNGLQSRIHSLEQGKELLGHQVRIHISGRGRVAYDNTIHPAFLTLNLKEVFFMTVVLKQHFHDTPFKELSSRIADDIYSQLSDYAKEILRPHIEAASILFTCSDPSVPIPYRTEVKDIIYFLKSGDRCSMQLMDGTIHVGKIAESADRFFMLTDDGRYVSIPDDQSMYTLTQC